MLRDLPSCHIHAITVAASRHCHSVTAKKKKKLSNEINKKINEMAASDLIHKRNVIGNEKQQKWITTGALLILSKNLVAFSDNLHKLMENMLNMLHMFRQ